MFYLQKCKNEAYEELINLRENCVSELQWWQNHLLSTQ